MTFVWKIKVKWESDELQYYLLITVVFLCVNPLFLAKPRITL
jgi:hypothetical protein